ncbi:MAG: patatin-like phospholipase family protein [Deltaproteobacteria bacterium]|nr:patatin-like phospholipase family protein [Deltaproteobacteria bacterium]MBW2400098.1 patatin-like phospholipase family protein [Deltaproteobacteria bacterium]MBW2667880.1 patatin-like phospholipase family protein [Deltaproteobacteria bacterium]
MTKFGCGSNPRLFLVVLLLSTFFGCASWTPANEPLERADPKHGYRPNLPEQHRDSGSVNITLAFSGGGTRAAAFAYGVLEELRDTEVVVEGERKRLVDEVDSISGVSGGSFPAAYYGLYGDQIFEEFEPNFLKRNVQGALIRQIFAPKNFFRLMTPATSRSELASQYYDKHLFHGATFRDLSEAQGPRIYINATDLSHGNRFTFSQGQFDVICSDLDEFRISHAVASSSAVPGLLSPITLQNHAGSCGYEPGELFEEALRSRTSDPRRYRAAKSFFDYQNEKQRPYIHLVDGGTSDNLGLRASLDMSAAVGGYKKLRELMGIEVPDHVVLVIVNAETDPNPNIDVEPLPPSLMVLMNAVSGGQIRRYNFETLILAQEAINGIARDLSTPEQAVKGHFVEVSFDSIIDEDERRYFKGLPTSFVLEDEEVDRLREAGRRLLRNSAAFQDLLSELR